MFIKFDFFKYCYLVIYVVFLFIFLFNILSPNEAFAMEPSDIWITNFYGGKEYIGPNPYAYFHPEPAPDIDTIQSRVSASYGPSIKDDWYDPKIIKSTSSIHELDSKPLYELDGKPIYKSINPPYDRDELHFWTQGQSIRGDIPVKYYFEPKHTTFELDTGSIEGTISTNVDSVTWHRRHNNDMEIIRDYCTYVDNMSISKKGLLTKVSLCVKTTKNNITYIYIKCNEKGKRKIFWTIWERNRDRYQSYKEFKINWNNSSSILSTIKKDIKEDIIIEVEDLLGVRKMKKDLKKTVRSEVEKLLRERQPFRS